MYKPGSWFLLAKMFEKHPSKSDISSKDAGQWPASLLEVSLLYWCFSNIFASKNQLRGLSVNGILVENALIPLNSLRVERDLATVRYITNASTTKTNYTILKIIHPSNSSASWSLQQFFFFFS